MEIKNNIYEWAQTFPNISVTIKLSELIEFGKLLIAETKREFEQQIKEQNTETYPSREEVMKILGVSTSTLWHYKKKGLLKPLDSHGKRRYRMSDVKRFMKGGNH